MSANKCKILRFLADNFFTVIIAAVAAYLVRYSVAAAVRALYKCRSVHFPNA